MEKVKQTAAEQPSIKNYFDNIKKARAFAAKNDSKVKIVNLDSSRRYCVETAGRGIR